VEQYGNVGLNLNPDPSGGHWTSPPLSDKHWYPIYEKMVEYDLPAMIHVSTSCNACFHTTGAHYLNADTTAFMQLIQGDLFKDFPTLKFLIPHGGGAVPYHWGRFRGLAQEMKKPLLDEHLMNNVYFDTCVYHQPGIDLLNTVIPVKNVLFASEMIGAVRGIDPTTGDFEHEWAEFSYSFDGVNFWNIGKRLPIPYQTKIFQGARYALFALNRQGKEGGYAEFDDFNVEEPLADRSRNIPFTALRTTFPFPLSCTSNIQSEGLRFFMSSHTE
jgi:hypothetical protein